MTRIAIVLSMIVLALLAGCNNDEAGKDTQVQAQTPAAKTPAAKTPATVSTQPAPEYTSVAGTMIADSRGAEVRVVSVGDFDQNVMEMNGLVAIEGRVSEVYPDRGAFMLVDYERMEDCGDGCCPQATVPVRLALDDFKGNLPELETEIVIVGDLTLNEAGGYELAIQEIRRGDEILLSRAPNTA